VIDPWEAWLPRRDVPTFLSGLAAHLGQPLDVEDLLDRLLDTDISRGRWLVLPVRGPLTVELGAEPGTGDVELRARATGPGADELLAALRPLGAVYSR
jgi:hypothetical protein